MWHLQRSSLWMTYTKAWHVTIMDSLIQHSSEAFHHQDKQQRGKWITLSQPPGALKKNLYEVSFIKIEKWTVDIQKKIHRLHLAKNPLHSSNCIRKPQLTWSKAFSTSNLQSTPGKPIFPLLSRHSLAISTRSRIYLFLTKAFLEEEIISSMTVRSLMAKTLAMIL